MEPDSSVIQKRCFFVIVNIISVASPNMLNHRLTPAPAPNDTLAPSDALENTSTIPAMTNGAVIRSFGLRPQQTDSKDKTEELAVGGNAEH